MMELPSISNAFETIVAATEQAIIADTSLNWGSLAKRVYFMHGHPKEVVQVLQQYTQSAEFKNKKYPLVALFRDIKETIGIDGSGPYIKFKAHFVICTLTTPTFRAKQREQAIFKPILHPIFNELIDQICNSPLFGMPSMESLNIEKWDRYYWGTQAADKNILNDHIDAIEVTNIDLKLYNKNCKSLKLN